MIFIEFLSCSVVKQVCFVKSSNSIILLKLSYPKKVILEQKIRLFLFKAIKYILINYSSKCVEYVLFQFNLHLLLYTKYD